MPTQDQLRRRTADFEREYPESLSDRLQWWVRVLDIDRIRLFQVLGLSGLQAARTPLTDMPRVVDAQEDRAEIVDDMLGYLLASYDYDLPASAQPCTNPWSPRPRKRAVPVSPFRFPTLPPQVRRGLLLNQIVLGGPSGPLALLAYLSEPTTSNGRRGKRTR